MVLHYPQVLQGCKLFNVVRWGYRNTWRLNGGLYENLNVNEYRNITTGGQNLCMKEIAALTPLYCRFSPLQKVK